MSTVLCLLLVEWLLVYCYSSLGDAANPAGKCNLAGHCGREGVPPWFSFALESQRREVLTAPKPSALPLGVECLRFHLEETDP
jgi:hypothetical protein